MTDRTVTLDVLDRSFILGGSHISMVELVGDLNDQDINAYFWCFQKLVDCDKEAFKALEFSGALQIINNVSEKLVWPAYFLTCLYIVFRRRRGFVMATGYSFTLVGILSLLSRKRAIFSVRALIRAGLLARCRFVLNALVADVTVCNSNAVATSVERQIPRWLLRFVRIEVIHNYLDSRAALLCRLQSGVRKNSDALRIGFVGRAADPVKGFSSALWCFSKLRKEKNFEFYVFQPDSGSGVAVPDWVGGFFGEKVENIFGRLDLLVLTSHAEGFPRVILEAMCARKLVVARNVGGVSELVVHGQTGFLFRSDEECYEILRSIDSGQVKLVGQKGRKFVRENFSLSVAISKYKCLFEEMV